MFLSGTIDTVGAHNSKHHIERVLSKNAPLGDGDECSSSNSSLCFPRTRSQSPYTEFDWKKKCFICSGTCSQPKRNTWCMVETVVDNTSKTKNLYAKVLLAAEQRQDHALLTRLLGVANSDLVALEARYHKKCSTYYNPRNISATQKLVTKENVFKKCIEHLTEEFKQPLESKQVFLLISITTRFRKLLAQNGQVSPEAYTTQKLKQQLKKEWPEVSFIQQPPASDLVCSSHISVGEALLKARELQITLDAMPLEADLQSESGATSTSEESIIHEAIGILQGRILATQSPSDEYYSAAEMTNEHQEKFIDPLFLKAIAWLTNPKLHATAGDFAECDQVHVKRCLNIASDIVTLATSVASPKHLGLAVYLQHEFGSRKLIDLMHDMGYIISYTELCRFLTSAALHVSNQQESTAAGSYIPPELTRRDDGGKFITAAADN